VSFLPARVGVLTFLTELRILILEYSYVLGFSTIPNIAHTPAISPGTDINWPTVKREEERRRGPTVKRVTYERGLSCATLLPVAGLCVFYALFSLGWEESYQRCAHLSPPMGESVTHPACLPHTLGRRELHPACFPHTLGRRELHTPSMPPSHPWGRVINTQHASLPTM